MRIKRESVLDFVVSRGYQPFTTTDIAEALEAKEYAVRAAISWLVLGQYIEVHGWHTTREHVKLYMWTGKIGEVTTVRRNRDEREYAQSCERFQGAAVELQNIFLMMRRV